MTGRQTIESTNARQTRHGRSANKRVGTVLLQHDITEKYTVLILKFCFRVLLLILSNSELSLKSWVKFCPGLLTMTIRSSADPFQGHGASFFVADARARQHRC